VVRKTGYEEWLEDNWADALDQLGLSEPEELSMESGQRTFKTSLGFLCKHPPRHVLKSESDGWEVWAGARYDCYEYLGHFDVLLNLSGELALAGHQIPLAGLERWSRRTSPTEVVLDWPDMGVVDLPVAFWKELIGYLAANKTRLLVFCVGGHGRTGTALACLMVASGWSSQEAIEWIRTNYCASAIESKKQEAYIRAIEEGSSQAASAKQPGTRKRRSRDDGES
jgi:hypothetical protein